MNRRFKLFHELALGCILLGVGGLLLVLALNGYLTAAQATAPRPDDRTSIRWNPNSGSEQPLILTKGARVSHLEVPRLKQSLYVVEGSDEAALKTGPGHVQGTAMPGEEGNCVIAGHRDTHFRFLRNVRPGDRIFLETVEGRFCYRVTGTEIISPAKVEVLQPTKDPQLHLITCFPFQYVGHAPKRYVVSAVLD